jgi:HemY protein
MRLSLWALLAVFIGAFGAHFLLQDKGYVLIDFRGYAIEMSVPALVLTLVMLYALVRLLVRIWRTPRHLGSALAGIRARRAGDKLTRGLVHMTEGDWNRAERLLTQGLRGSEAPLVNYLMAARAAQLQGSRDRRNEWLKLAYEALPEAEVAVLLTQAELQFSDGEFERALATLKRIEEKQPDHPAAVALLAQTLNALGDREGLIALLPRLGRAKLPTETLARIATASLEAVLKRTDVTYEEYQRLWSGLSSAVRRLPGVVRMHCRVLDRLGKGDEAVQELAGALKRRWEPDLVRAYGEVAAKDMLKQLKRAEGWLKAHPEDGLLLLTVARLCMLNELWGKARSYLESSLALSPDPDAYALYGRLLDQLGERDQAALAYHSGLSLLRPEVAALPALDAPRTPALEPEPERKKA